MANKKFVFIWMIGIIIIFASANYFMKSTSTIEFCSEQCHEMGKYAEELKYSSHALNYRGNPIDCAMCHLPDDIVGYTAVKVYSGIKDIYVHYFGNPDDLDRLALQKSARLYITDANCMRCHKDLYKAGNKKDPISELGRIAHDSYLGKDGQAKSKCVGCHTNIAHLPNFDKRYDKNQEFASRMENNKMYLPDFDKHYGDWNPFPEHILNVINKIEENNNND